MKKFKKILMIAIPLLLLNMKIYATEEVLQKGNEIAKYGAILLAALILFLIIYATYKADKKSELKEKLEQKREKPSFEIGVPEEDAVDIFANEYEDKLDKSMLDETEESVYNSSNQYIENEEESLYNNVNDYIDLKEELYDNVEQDIDKYKSNIITNKNEKIKDMDFLSYEEVPTDRINNSIKNEEISSTITSDIELEEDYSKEEFNAEVEEYLNIETDIEETNIESDVEETNVEETNVEETNVEETNIESDVEEENSNIESNEEEIDAFTFDTAPIFTNKQEIVENKKSEKNVKKYTGKKINRMDSIIKEDIDIEIENEDFDEEDDEDIGVPTFDDLLKKSEEEEGSEIEAFDFMAQMEENLKNDQKKRLEKKQTTKKQETKKKSTKKKEPAKKQETKKKSTKKKKE